MNPPTVTPSSSSPARSEIGAPLVVDWRRALRHADRPSPALAVGLRRPCAVGIAPVAETAALVGQEVAAVGGLGVVAHLRLELDERLRGNALEDQVDRAARRVALLVGREGLRDLQAVDHRGRELVEFDAALVLVGGRKPRPVDLRTHVAIGQAAYHREAVDDGRAGHQPKRARRIAHARPADERRTDRVHERRALHPQAEQPDLGAPAHLQLLHHVLLELEEVARERAVDLGELPGGHHDVAADLTGEALLREDQRVAARRHLAKDEVALGGRGGLSAGLADGDLGEGQRRVEVAIDDKTADRPGLLPPRRRADARDRHDDQAREQSESAVRHG